MSTPVYKYFFFVFAVVNLLESSALCLDRFLVIWSCQHVGSLALHGQRRNKYHLIFPRVKTSACCRITTYDSRPIPRAGKHATSLAFLGRRIGRADGPDRAFPSYFAKKPSNLREINPRSKFLS